MMYVNPFDNSLPSMLFDGFFDKEIERTRWTKSVPAPVEAKELPFPFLAVWEPHNTIVFAN